MVHGTVHSTANQLIANSNEQWWVLRVFLNNNNIYIFIDSNSTINEFNHVIIIMT